MSKSLRGLVCPLFLAVLFTTFSFAVTPDRVSGDLAGGPKVQLNGNMHGLARPENDLGRADGNRLIEGVSLTFRLSPEQQKDLDEFLIELADRSSPNFHKYLTIPQYARRFGMSQNDLNKVVAWIQSQGFTNIKVANNRNKISFDGTVAQIESMFAVEMHNYLVDGEVHLASAMNPSVPAALSGAVLYVGHLHDFAPKPRIKARPNLTSYLSGNHFLTPADFATIYDVNSLYAAGSDGTGQKIAIVGQSTISTTDLSNFRTAAGLPASTVTMKLMEGTGTRCSGDEGESDLDVEWSGGIAKNAQITFIYAGLGTNDTCSNRFDNIWDALEDALTGTTTGVAGSPVAPFVSTSYGFCEQGMQAQSPGFYLTIQSWVQTGQTLGVTLVAASGDSGAADCDLSNSISATQGLAVDVPASIPEVTGAGGTEFSADSPTYTTPNPPGANPPYWAGAGTTTDTVSSALAYIPETAWNDTALALANQGGLSASGGGASVFFTKPTWQTGALGTMRNVPDIALSSSPDHDPYLLCSEDFQFGHCAAGFRDSAAGNFGIVGGTSVAAPTFTAILALVNQYLGNTPPNGLAPVNPTLYLLAVSNPGAFHDVTTGDNKVPCTTGTTNCPTGTTSIGFTAGIGYDQVTGLGSVDGFALAQAMSTQPGFTLALKGGGSLQVAQGSNINAEVDLTPLNGFTGAVTYTCTDAAPESTCTGPTGAIASTQPASFSITTKAPTAKLERPFDRSVRIFYAMLLPGLLGIVFVAGSRKRSTRGMRLLGLMMVLGFSTLWLGSCGGSSSSTKDPGTPVGSYSITVKGVSGTLTRQTTFQLVVVP
ncbi:MAG TPA: S53 family peptidase [Candidatus Dormibacteraeota bacterium]|nr:S53 family peptidase [Candidatus Dormibacteraeota bacterium]